MDLYIAKCKLTFKFVAAFFLLFLSLIFVSPAQATSREVNTTYNPPAIQLAYHGYHHHHYWRHHHWRHHHWCRHHWCYHRHHRHHWYYY